MERLTYDFCIGGNHCWQVKGADNLECREVCQRQEDKGCKDCPIAKAFDRLASIEDILGDEYDLDRLRELAQADREGRCVVPVVRCRDCKHGKRGVDNMVRCSHPCGKVISMTAENFCSYGQRKIETVLPINDTKDENLVMI